MKLRRTTTPGYKSWWGMIMRCTNPRNRKYRLYGGRGIQICDRWRLSFDAFISDMGPRPSPKHSIDRIDNDGNYEPGNCRWATMKEQNLNKQRTRYLVVDGTRVPVSLAADAAGLSRNTVFTRLANGEGLTRDLLRRSPIASLGNRRAITHDGHTLWLAEWARRSGMKSDTLRRRLKMGMPFALAITLPVSASGRNIKPAKLGGAQ